MSRFPAGFFEAVAGEEAFEAAQAKRSAGELGLAPAECVCDPMDLAALGHMTTCPCYKEKEDVG